MGVQSDLIIADLADARALAESAGPAARGEGLACGGLDNIKLGTLLSLLRTGDPARDFDGCLDRIDAIASPAEDGPVVFALHPAEVATLAAVAALGPEEFGGLITAWGGTEEFAGWPGAEIGDLLRAIGDLAETAALQGQCLLLLRSPG